MCHILNISNQQSASHSDRMTSSVSSVFFIFESCIESYLVRDWISQPNNKNKIEIEQNYDTNKIKKKSRQRLAAIKQRYAIIRNEALVASKLVGLFRPPASTNGVSSLPSTPKKASIFSDSSIRARADRNGRSVL